MVGGDSAPTPSSLTTRQLSLLEGLCHDPSSVTHYKYCVYGSVSAQLQWHGNVVRTFSQLTCDHDL